MKIAIIHDHLTQIGGAENVLRVFHDMWSDSTIFTLLYNDSKMGEIFGKMNIHTSFLQKMPFAVKHYQWYLPLMPLATESYDVRSFDIVLSSSSAFAKGVITNPETLHFCYCHTPTRYLWSDTHNYLKELRYPKIIRALLPSLLHRLRIWDKIAADRVDYFIANSHFVASRIEKYYRRKSVVIYPPVDTKRFFISPNVGDYFLTGGRMVAYKRFDLTIRAFNQLRMKLKIFGDGPIFSELKKIAKSNIEFCGKVSEKEMAELYSKSIAFIHPHIEDFGMTAVESMASGRPVIAFKAGGALETVLENITGTFFDEQSWESLADTIIRFKADQYDPKIIHEHAMKFDAVRFKKEIQNYIEAMKLQKGSIVA